VRVLFDTNVVLDLLLDRRPWSATAAELFARVEGGTLDGYLGATTLTTIHYLATKAVGAEAARQHVAGLLALCEVAAVDRTVLAEALALGFGDFEDAVLHEAARSVGAEAIVTRDPRGFRKGSLLVLTPEECAEILKLLPT
jgi:predicted nucleic acid-binding protein